MSVYERIAPDDCEACMQQAISYYTMSLRGALVATKQSPVNEDATRLRKERSQRHMLPPVLHFLPIPHQPIGAHAGRVGDFVGF